MSDWHGYPQQPDTHPERPWWRIDGDDEDAAWVRTDGDTLRLFSSRGDALFLEADTAAVLAAYDAAHPLPPPGPRCGQVWVDPDGCAWTVLGVEPSPRGGWQVRDPWEQILYRVDADPFGPDHNSDAPWPWPPPGAVLVAGPGAPWAPTEA